MPSGAAEDMEAINRYFMEQTKIRTPAAEAIKQEWMKWWMENKRDWSWYSQEEYDFARNMRKKLDLANATTEAQRDEIRETHARGITSEELKGETRRAGTDGMYIEPEKPFIPTSWKVAAGVGTGLVILGVFAKKILANTPLGRLAKLLA